VRTRVAGVWSQPQTIGSGRKSKKRKEKIYIKKGIMDFYSFLSSGEAILPNGPQKRLQLPKRIGSFVRIGTGAVF
jgi:hypothetical protein